MRLQYIPGSSREKFWFPDGQLVLLGGSQPPPLQAPSLRESLCWGGWGLLRYWVFLGWGGRGWEEVEEGRMHGLMPAPRPPGWSSGVPEAERWTSSSCPRSTWGRRRESGRPSARGVCGWPGGPVSGSRSPGAEPPESEAGPANDKEASERRESTAQRETEKHGWKEARKERMHKIKGWMLHLNTDND